MYSGSGTRALPRVGFPIRRSRDQRLVSTSPGLIAAAHVLLRLLAPRHPPCALHLLIVKNTVVLPLWSFQGARRPPLRAVLQNSAACNVEVDIVLGELDHPTASRAILGVERLRSKSSAFPRKEVIQPQLPLRLPCYDFTPVTNPTFGGCLRERLAHRLRVLPASVV